MYGVFVDGNRPKTKKALKEAAEKGINIVNGSNTRSVNLEATSLFGNEYNGPLANAPNGTYTVVGPDPFTARNWYATITVKDGTVKVK